MTCNDRAGKREDLTVAKRGTLKRSFHRLPLYVTDGAVSVGEITTLVATMAADGPVGLLVVDYLQLVRGPRDIRDRRLQVEAVSQALKTLALQHQVLVLCASSLSRSPSDDKPPTLASLRESGELEYDADVVLLLHRGMREEATTCYVAKNRNGRLGSVELAFRDDAVVFDERRTISDAPRDESPRQAERHDDGTGLF